MTLQIDLQTARTGYDRETCWVQTRCGLDPVHHKAVITSQKLRLTGSDIFYDIHSMSSDADGEHWGDLQTQSAFQPRPQDDSSYFYVSDFWPKWHAHSQTLLGTGHAPLYKDDELCHAGYARKPVFSTYDSSEDSWSPWRFMDLPGDEPFFYNCGAGSTQRVDLENGEILLPIYCRDVSKGTEVFSGRDACCVLRCSFDGDTLRCLEYGNFLELDVSRGFAEPSLAALNGKTYLTLRNDEKGYVTKSDDGLHFDNPVPWTFDDGEEIGNYNTQQHWVNLGGKLSLVYTRRGLDNDHVLRHRAPLVSAQFDPDRMCLLRDTERVVIPQRGARLGNFGVTPVSDTEAWVVVSEWMQGPKGTNGDPRELEAHGSDNTVFIAKVTLV
jgi:hypothetical protein